MDDVLCGQVTYASGTSVYEIQCRLSGRIVKIAQETTTKPLTLCEVEAYGYSISGNELTFKPAILDEELTFTSAVQGSTISNGAAWRAIDGNTDGEYLHR